MRPRLILSAICFVWLAPIASAQDFDAPSFEDAVNEAIRDMPGVSFSMTDEANPAMRDKMTELGFDPDWVTHAFENAPEFGFVVYDSKGLPVDVIGGNAPFQTMGKAIEITGYNLPEGYTVNTVGKAGYIDAVTAITGRVAAPSDDVENAIRTVRGASAYIVQELCDAVGRPTEITLNLTAGFKLAFSVETGSKFHWDLEVVCLR